MNSRDENDVKMGGLTGIALAIVIAGGLPILSVAGARALDPTITSYSYDAVIGAQGGFLFTGGATQIRGGPSASAYNSYAAFLLGGDFQRRQWRILADVPCGDLIDRGASVRLLADGRPRA